MFVQGDLTHQGTLLCFCCKALKRLCLCCKALEGEPLNLCKYSEVVLTFDFVKSVWKTLCATLLSTHKSISAIFFFSAGNTCTVFTLPVMMQSLVHCSVAQLQWNMFHSVYTNWKYSYTTTVCIFLCIIRAMDLLLFSRKLNSNLKDSRWWHKGLQAHKDRPR